MKRLEQIDVHMESGRDITLYIYEHEGTFFRSQFSGLEEASEEDMEFEMQNHFNEAKSKAECITDLKRVCENVGATIIRRTNED